MSTTTTIGEPCENLALLGDAYRNDAVNGSANVGIAELDLGFSVIGAGLRELGHGSGERALAYIHLLAVGLGDTQSALLCFDGIFESFYVRFGNADVGFGMITVLRGDFAFGKELLRAIEIGLIAPEGGLGLLELGIRRSNHRAGLIERRIGLALR